MAYLLMLDRKISHQLSLAFPALMHDAEIIISFSSMALVVAVLAWGQHSRANQIVRQWAQTTEVELVSAQNRYLRTGPFFLENVRGQFVFRIVVRDQTGSERTGWLRVGGGLTGVLSAKTKVVWDS